MNFYSQTKCEHGSKYFNSIGVEVVSPCRCTGEDAERPIGKIFKGKYVRWGPVEFSLFEGGISG